MRRTLKADKNGVGVLGKRTGHETMKVKVLKKKTGNWSTGYKWGNSIQGQTLRGLKCQEREMELESFTFFSLGKCV